MTFAVHNVVDEFSPEVEKLTHALKLRVRGGSQTHACANDLASYAAYLDFAPNLNRSCRSIELSIHPRS